MKLGYSEFSFGYAFTENLIRSSPKAPNGAPVFPNLVQEARESASGGDGWVLLRLRRVRTSGVYGHTHENNARFPKE